MARRPVTAANSAQSSGGKSAQETKPLAKMRTLLLKWGRQHFRKFSWRNQHSLYTTLVTEVLLRQTNANRVEGIWQDFLGKYPTPGELAASKSTDLAALLQPLGLSAQRAPQLIDLGNALHALNEPPMTLRELLGLPGVGPYAAAAAACFSLGQPEVAFDVNVARIVSRVFGVVPERGELRRSRELLRLARQFVTQKNSREMNWALLDLGALVCKPHPECSRCPLRIYCEYAAQELTKRRM
jgi:A/G-specific adenine glycosylase